MKIRYSVSDGPRGHCPRLFVLRVGHISRQNPPDILNIVVTRDGQPFIVWYALHPPPPLRARHVVYARDGAGNTPIAVEFSS